MKFTLKVVVTCVLIGIIVLNIDWGALSNQAANLLWIAMLPASAVLFLEFPVSAWKWRSALALHDLHYSPSYLLKIHCIAYFLNNLLPSAIGGDIYRVYRTLAPTVPRSRAVSAVLLDRTVGFGALLALGAVAALSLLSTNGFARVFLEATVFLGLAGILGLIAIYRGWFRLITRYLRRYSFYQAVEANAALILRRHSSWPSLIAGSVSFQVLAALWLYFLFVSLNSSLGFAECALISAMVGLASVLPISISGLGIVEGSIVATGVALGAPYEAAVLVALLNRLGVALISIPCGFVYLFEGRVRPDRI